MFSIKISKNLQNQDNCNELNNDQYVVAVKCFNWAILLLLFFNHI